MFCVSGWIALWIQPGSFLRRACYDLFQTPSVARRSPILLTYSSYRNIADGVFTDMGDYIENPETLDWNPSKQGWLVSILELGAWLGCLYSGFLAEILSRKYAILVNVSIFILGVIIQATAIAGSNGASNILAGRFITGMGVGSLSMIVPMYNAEIAPPEVRGALVGLQQLSITLGIMISFWIDYGTVSLPTFLRLPLSLTCLPELHRRPRPQPEEQRLALAPLSPTRSRRPPRRWHDIHAFFSPLARAP
jgi:MFS family permease